MGEWTHVVWSYDGSSRAAGLRLAALGAAQSVGGHAIGSLHELPPLVLRGDLR